MAQIDRRTPKVSNHKIRGVDVDTTRFIDNETPTPATNGIQLVFTTANPYVAGSLKVYIDGLRQIKTTDYTETLPSAGTFTMTIAPESIENLRVDYVKS
jgi:hypothetical protein